MAPQGYQRCFEKGKSQLGSENPYHISILLTFSPGLQVSESVYKSLTLFRHPSRRQEHKGSKISLLHVEHSLIVLFFFLILILLIYLLEGFGSVRQTVWVCNPCPLHQRRICRMRSILLWLIYPIVPALSCLCVEGRSHRH